MTLAKIIPLLIFTLITLNGLTQPLTPKVSLIAHAGGSIDDKTYTNSLEALNVNYANGYELFEIDFIWTSDGHLVCLHDWQGTAKWLLDYHGQQALTLAEFNQLEHPKLRLKPCDLYSLNQWLITHPKAFIVTDIKNDNVRGLSLIKNTIWDAESRIIPQIYQPEEYQMVKDLGYRSIIWTLYQFLESAKTIVKTYKKMDLFAIAMPEYRATQGLAEQLNDPQTPTYVHTINERSQALYLKNTHGISSFYTDTLAIDFAD